MGLVWSKCPRCHLKFFDLDLKLDFIDGKRYCDNCLREIREERAKEEARRKEEERRKAVEEYQAKKRQEAEQREAKRRQEEEQKRLEEEQKRLEKEQKRLEKEQQRRELEARLPAGFKTKTLTKEEYDSLDEFHKDEYRKVPKQWEEEAKSFREKFLSQPKNKIKEVYDPWAFRMYMKRTVGLLEHNQANTNDELEKQVYGKEITILRSCKSIDELRITLNTLPHYREINDVDAIYKNMIYIRRHYYNYNDRFDYWTIDVEVPDYWWSPTIILSKEDTLLYLSFCHINLCYLNQYFPIIWDRFCDVQYDEYMKAEKAKAEKQASFASFLASSDVKEDDPVQKDEQSQSTETGEKEETEKQSSYAEVPATSEIKETVPEQKDEQTQPAGTGDSKVDSPAAPVNGENDKAPKAKKPRRIDTGNTLFSAKWKSIE